MEENTKFHKKEFWMGTVIGLLTTMIIGLLALAVVLGKGMLHLGQAEGTQPAPQSSQAYSGSSAVDELLGHSDLSEEILNDETQKKLKYIAGVFDLYSIYDIPAENLQRGMIDGLMAGSGDKYAEYYNPEELEKLMQDLDGTFYGIGALLFLGDLDCPEVSSVFEDSPAQKAGIQAGDTIVAVNGVDVQGETLDRAVSMIRGDKGTEVVLKIYRASEPDYLTITCVRDKITETTVDHEMLDGGVGYIMIRTFSSVTVDQFKTALQDLKDQNMKALIIDLRSNTGGLLEAVVEIAQQLLPKGLVVYTEDSFGEREEFTCDGTKELMVPIVVLTNELTASASEILTGALQDHGKATIMGTTTYGKGIVQSFISMSDGSAIKLTTEQYFTPNGRAIHGTGIEPDIVVEFDADAYYADDSFDNQKYEAKKYLLEQIK